MEVTRKEVGAAMAIDRTKLGMLCRVRGRFAPFGGVVPNDIRPMILQT
jgi:hypothetical protein